MFYIPCFNSQRCLELSLRGWSGSVSCCCVVGRAALAAVAWVGQRWLELSLRGSDSVGWSCRCVVEAAVVK